VKRKTEGIGGKKGKGRVGRGRKKGGKGMGERRVERGERKWSPASIRMSLHPCTHYG